MFYIRHFTIPVVPGTTLSLSVGGNGGEVPYPYSGSEPGSASSNAGAIYIRYLK
jgi:hypothetical protein